MEANTSKNAYRQLLMRKSSLEQKATKVHEASMFIGRSEGAIGDHGTILQISLRAFEDQIYSELTGLKQELDSAKHAYEFDLELGECTPIEGISA